MGYLTTLTIYNDGIDTITKDSKELCENIINAVCTGKETTVGHLGFGNLINVQKTRHADDTTIYVHYGNCVTELNAYSRETRELMERNPDFVDTLISVVESDLKALKKLRKKVKENLK